MILRLEKNDKLFYYAFLVWFASDIISTTTISRLFITSYMIVDRVINISVLLLLIIRILFYQNYTTHQAFFVLAISIIIIVSAINSNNWGLLSTAIFVLASMGLDFRRIVSYVFRVLLFTISFVSLLCLLGIIEDVTLYRGSTVRHSMGFIHSNIFGIRLFQLCICFLIISKGRRMLQIVIIVLITLMEYLIPNSKTAFILGIVLLIIMPIHYKIEANSKENSLFSNLLIGGTVLVSVTTLLGTVVNISQYDLLSSIDTFLSRRLTYAHRAFSESGVSLFGRTVYITAEDRHILGLPGHLYLDCSYAIILVRFGILALLGFLIWYIITMNNLKRKGNHLLVIIMFIYALYGVMEPTMFMLKYNIVLLTMGEALFENSQESKSYRLCVKSTY